MTENYYVKLKFVEWKLIKLDNTPEFSFPQARVYIKGLLVVLFCLLSVVLICVFTMQEKCLLPAQLE